MTKKNGFTFIEVIVTVSIISVLSVITIVSMKSLQINGRDARRVNDINEIRGALNIYFAKYNQYPTAITAGERFQIGNIIYLEKVPISPTPNTNALCVNNDYLYATQNNNTSYTLNFCLERSFADLEAGNNQITPEGINN